MLMQKYAKSSNISRFPHGKIWKIYLMLRGKKMKSFINWTARKNVFCYFEVNKISRVWIVDNTQKTLANKRPGFYWFLKIKPKPLIFTDWWIFLPFSGVSILIYLFVREFHRNFLISENIFTAGKRSLSVKVISIFFSNPPLSAHQRTVNRPNKPQNFFLSFIHVL